MYDIKILFVISPSVTLIRLHIYIKDSIVMKDIVMFKK